MDDQANYYQEETWKLHWGGVLHSRNPRAPDQAAAHIGVLICEEATQKSCAVSYWTIAEGQKTFQDPEHDWIGKWECQQDVESPAHCVGQDVLLAATSAAGNLAELNLKFDSREIKTENSMLEPVLTVLTMATPAWQPDPRKPETMRPKKPRALSGR